MPAHLRIQKHNIDPSARSRHNMFQFLRYLLPWTFSFLIAACRPLPGDSGWNQFHGGALNRGYMDVRSDVPLHPSWSVELGSLSWGSPVLDGNGNIYLATFDELVAVSSSGSVLWRRSVGEAKFLSSAAIGESGHVYVVSTREDEDATNGATSTLHAFEASGNPLWSFALPEEGYSLSSPKTWMVDSSEYVFLYGWVKTRGTLFILDQNGNLMYTQSLGCSGDIIGEGPGDIPGDIFDDFFSDIWDFIMEVFNSEFDTSGVDPDTKWGKLLIMPPDPTVAIQAGREDSQRMPIVVVADRQCPLIAYRWQPPNNLTQEWYWELQYEGGHSSPSISGGPIVLAGHDGVVRAYDWQTGKLLWEYKDEDVDEPLSFIATPAQFITPIYVVDIRGRIYAITTTGQLWLKVDSGGSTIASPALTRDWLYLSTYDGFHAYSTGFEQHWSDSTLRGGKSSPAIGPGGEVYVAGRIPNGEEVLRAYPGRPQQRGTPTSVPTP